MKKFNQSITLVVILISGILFANCSQPGITELEKLADAMIGSYNSEEQSIQDTNYFNITLHMVRIWPEETEAIYLYVEQTVTASPEKPYRQRVYKLEQLAENEFSSSIYLMPNPENWVLKWKDPAGFSGLKKEEITQKEGCAVYLSKLGENHYKGSTHEQDCKSDWGAAAYATSIVEIKEGQVMSWDRGFDAEGNYIWGAEHAGYVFKKITESIN